MTFAPIFILILFAAIILYLGWFHGDASNAESFNMADREAGWIEVAFSAFTVVGAGEYIGLTAYTYALGFHSLWLIAGFALGALMLAAFGGKAYARLRVHKYASLPDYVAAHYGCTASFLTATVSILALGALLLIQFSLGASILAAFLNVPLAATIAGVAIVVIGYVCLGGLKAILFTDVVQGSAMLLFLAAIVFSLLLGSDHAQFAKYLSRGAVPLVSNGDKSGLYFAIVLFVSGLTAISGGADLWQRLFCGETFSKGRRGMILCSALFIVFGILLAILATQILGIVAPADDAAAGNAFITYFAEHISPFWLGLAVIGLFAGLVSTADAELLVISIMTSRELHRLRLNQEVDSTDTKWFALTFGIVAAVGGYFAAGKLDDVFSILLFLLMITGAVASLCLFRRGNRVIVTSSLFLALGIFAALWVSGYIFTDLWSLLIPAPIFLCALVKEPSFDA